MAKRERKKIASNARPTGRSRRSVPKAGLAGAFAARAHSAVRKVFATTIDLPEFRETPAALSRDDRLRLVEQARVLIELNYVHLPLKEAMYGVDPVQRLKLVEHQLRHAPDEDLTSELQFHREMTQIFMSVRDLHTNYILPTPFQPMTAFVPFLVEEFFEDGERRYLVTRLSDGFENPPFEPGVEIVSWNGIPIARAVEIQGDRFAGSNPEARRARGVATLTVRRMLLALPPDEDHVTVAYKAADGNIHELRLDWLVFSSPAEEGELRPPESRDAEAAHVAALGVDLELDETNRVKKYLFAPDAVADEARIARRRRSRARQLGALEDEVPNSVLEGRIVNTPSGTFGYIRLRRFNFQHRDLSSVQKAQAIVNRFIQLAEQLPQEGLIIDVRGNGGGIIYAGEMLLQLLTPHEIEPERLQFINTELNLSLCNHLDFLAEWKDSIRQSVQTGAIYSRGFPITRPEWANAIGQRYHGPSIVLTDAQCYSTTDIFAAGYQDHGIGPILGVDGNTGAGGANVWTHRDLLEFFFPPEIPGSPYRPLPNKADMRVSIRRTLRVGESAGTPVEDLGVVPDLRHRMSRDDLVQGNVDLINRAAEVLSELPIRKLMVKDLSISGFQLKFVAVTLGLTRLEVIVDGRAQGTFDVADGEKTIEVSDVPLSLVVVRGFDEDQLVSARKIQIE